MGLTNPKSFTLITAVVPQFIVPAAGSTALQIAALGLIPLLIGLATDAAWAQSAGRARTWLANSPPRLTAIGRIGGISIVGVGLSVAVSGGNHEIADMESRVMTVGDPDSGLIKRGSH